MYDDTLEYYTESIHDHSKSIEALTVKRLTEKEDIRLADVQPKDTANLHHPRFGYTKSGLHVEEVVPYGDGTVGVILRSPGCAGSKSGTWNHPALIVGRANQEENHHASSFREFATIRYNRAGRTRAFEQAQKWAADIVNLTDAIDRKLEAEERERQEKEAEKEAERKAQQERASEFVDGKALIEFCSAGNRDAVDVVKRIKDMIAANRKRMDLPK